jgi:hypothetical protein
MTDQDRELDIQVSQAIHTIKCRSGITLEAWREALRRIFCEREHEAKR